LKQTDGGVGFQVGAPVRSCLFQISHNRSALIDENRAEAVFPNRVEKGRGFGSALSFPYFAANSSTVESELLGVTKFKPRKGQQVFSIYASAHLCL